MIDRILQKDFSLEKYGLFVRLVNENDADFILKLRTDSRLGQFIHPTENNLEKQIEWIREYKYRESKGTDLYFMFEKPKGTRLGVSRIYNVTETTFETGSWVFSKDAPFGSAFLGDIICHEIAFDLFPEKTNLHDIKKANYGVNKYADEFHPILISETEDTRFYKNNKENYTLYKDKYLAKLLPLVNRFNN